MNFNYKGEGKMKELKLVEVLCNMVLKTMYNGFDVVLCGFSVMIYCVWYYIMYNVMLYVILYVI